MKNHPSPPAYRRTTEMAADAMINEGGAIAQPSRAESEAELHHLRHSSSWPGAFTPAMAFWTGFATGLAVSLLERKLRSGIH